MRKTVLFVRVILPLVSAVFCGHLLSNERLSLQAKDFFDQMDFVPGPDNNLPSVSVYEGDLDGDGDLDILYSMRSEWDGHPQRGANAWGVFENEGRSFVFIERFESQDVKLVRSKSNDELYILSHESKPGGKRSVVQVKSYRLSSNGLEARPERVNLFWTH